MSLPKNKIKIKSGFWKDEHGKMVWAETDCYGNVKQLIDPLDIEGISRSANYSIVFVREYPDQNTFNGKTKKFFAQDIEMHLAENVDDSIVIKFDSSSKKFFISDLKPLGQTFLAPIESTPELIVTKSEPYPISQTIAKDILGKYDYGFGKVEVSGQNIDYYTTI